MVRFDPYSYEHHEDPFPIYRRLRDEAPVYEDAKGWYALSRYADVRAAVDDWETYSSARGITLDHLTGGFPPMMLETDPPRHTELRNLVSRAFTPKRIAELEGPTRELARRLVAGFAESGRCDLIGDFSGLLPMAVISLMLGVAPEDQERLRSATDAMLHREEGDDTMTPAGLEGAAYLYRYFDRLIPLRRAHPGDDLVSALIAAQDEGRSLTHEDVLGFCILLIIAGNETTTKLVGNAISWLERFPDERARVLADPSLITGAVEETLRYDGSTQAMARSLTRDVELRGVTMPAGAKVLLLFGSANRDERQWPDPNRFDVTRNPAGHLAFGHGIHHCLGAALARLESRVALEELLPVLGEYSVRRDGCTRVHSGNVRGYASLPIEFTPRVPSRAAR